MPSGKSEATRTKNAGQLRDERDEVRDLAEYEVCHSIWHGEA